MSDFQVQIVPKGSTVIVQLHGDATVQETDRFRIALEPALADAPTRVVLDLSLLTFINSMGLGVLLEFRKKLASSKVDLRLAGASAKIVEVFQRTRLAELFPMFPTADQAAGV
jgi:anti-sigma B factor antagonist